MPTEAPDSVNPRSQGADRRSVLGLMPTILALVLLALSAFLVLRAPRSTTPADGNTRQHDESHSPSLRGVSRDDGGAEPVPAQPVVRGVPASSPAVAVLVEVTSRRARQPIQGAAVYSSVSAHETVALREAVHTDHSGKATLMLDSAHTFVNVWANGFLPAQVPVQPGTIAVSLDEGRSVRGLALGPDDQPLASVLVSCYLPANGVASLGQDHQQAIHAGGRAAAAHGRSDSRGRFFLTGLPYDSPLELVARKQGWLGVTPIAIESAQDEVEVRFVPTYEVHFSFRDASSGESVTSVHPGPAWQMPPDMWMLSGRSTDQNTLLAGGSIDKTVGFKQSFRMLPAYRGKTPSGDAAKLKYTFRTLGYRPVSGEVQLVPAEVVWTTVDLEPADRERVSVTFRARFPNGSAYSGPLLLHVEPEALGSDQGLVDLLFVDGRTTPTLMPPGRHRLTPRGGSVKALLDLTEWWNPAGNDMRVDLDPSKPPPEIDLKLAGERIRVTLRGPDGGVVRGFRFGVGPGGGSFREAGWWDVHQEFAARQMGVPFSMPALYLPPGDWKVRASVPGVGEAVETVHVAGEGGERDLELRLTRAE